MNIYKLKKGVRLTYPFPISEKTSSTQLERAVKYCPQLLEKGIIEVVEIKVTEPEPKINEANDKKELPKSSSKSKK